MKDHQSKEVETEVESKDEVKPAVTPTILPPRSVLQRVQFQLIPWQAYNFPGRPSWQPLLGAVEEIGELAHAFLKLSQGIRGTRVAHLEAMEDAIGDTIVFLCDFGNSQGIDVERALDRTWEKVRHRDWQRSRATGSKDPHVASTACPGVQELPPDSSKGSVPSGGQPSRPPYTHDRSSHQESQADLTSGAFGAVDPSQGSDSETIPRD